MVNAFDSPLINWGPFVYHCEEIVESNHMQVMDFFLLPQVVKSLYIILLQLPFFFIYFLMNFQQVHKDMLVE